MVITITFWIIQGVIGRVILKSAERAAQGQYRNYEHDYYEHDYTQGPITNND